MVVKAALAGLEPARTYPLTEGALPFELQSQTADYLQPVCQGGPQISGFEPLLPTSSEEPRQLHQTISG